MLHSQQFVESLIELRAQYQAQQEEDQCSSAHAKEQLAHVNALLVEQLMRQHNQQPVSIQASTVNENPALTQATSLSREESPTAFDKVDELSQVDEPNKPVSVTEVTNVDFDTQQEDQEDQPAFPTPVAAVVRSEAELSPDSSVNDQALKRAFPPLKTPMLPKYQNLTKTQAVEKLLREHEGTILHLDYIIRALYGELDADAIREEKPRIFDTLSKGTSKGLWDKVPDQASCYTIDLKLVDLDLAAKAQQQSQFRKRIRQQARGKRRA